MERSGLIQALAARIGARRPPHPLRVAVDGVDTAGKTILAAELAQRLTATGRPAIQASLDGFHQPREVRYRQGKLSPAGYYADSFNLPALVENLLQPLGPGGDRHYRTAVFDYLLDEPVESPVEIAPPEAILLLDGIFLQRPELNPYWDYRIFVQISFDEMLRRALVRDVAVLGSDDAVRECYARRYIPAQENYLGTHRPAEKAEVVIGNETPARPHILR